MGATTRLGWSRRGPIATVQRIAGTVPCRAPGTVATALRRGPASDAADNALANLPDKAATEPELLIQRGGPP